MRTVAVRPGLLQIMAGAGAAWLTWVVGHLLYWIVLGLHPSGREIVLMLGGVFIYVLGIPTAAAVEPLVRRCNLVRARLPVYGGIGAVEGLCLDLLFVFPPLHPVGITFFVSVGALLAVIGVAVGLRVRGRSAVVAAVVLPVMSVLLTANA